MRVFLLGGNGFVGKGICRVLNEIGVDLTVIDRRNYNDFIGKKCDLLINANGNSKKYLGEVDPIREFNDSVLSVRNSIEDFLFDKYIYLSSSDVYPDVSKVESTTESMSLEKSCQSVYGFHKYLAELCVKKLSNDWLIIRQGGFVGHGLVKNSVYDVLYGNKLWVHPDSRFQFIDTYDSAHILMALVFKGVSCEVFNLTATGTVSPNEVMLMSGRKVNYYGSEAPIHCEISTDKISRFVGLPSTYDCVSRFIANEYK